MSLIILCDRPGYLGNLLVLFSNFAALAIERNFQILNPSFSLYKHYFEGTCDQLVPCFNANALLSNVPLSYRSANTSFRLLRRLNVNIPKIIHTISLDWTEKLDLDQPENQNYFNFKVNLVGGWLFRCDLLVEKYRSKLATFFKPLKIFRDEAFIHKTRACQYFSAQTLIGIHIRRRDYRYFQGGRYFYSLSLYISLMHSLATQYPTPLAFIVVSDEPLSINDFYGLNVYISNSSEMVDMTILSLCDGVIGPPSTFSYSASCILGNNNLLHIEQKNQEIPASFLNSLMMK